jgi:hypothetical protein
MNLAHLAQDVGPSPEVAKQVQDSEALVQQLHQEILYYLVLVTPSIAGGKRASLRSKLVHPGLEQTQQTGYPAHHLGRLWPVRVTWNYWYSVWSKSV